MGVLDYIEDLLPSFSSSKKKKKLMKRQLQTVEIKVKMDCEGCERRVKKSVEGMKGVTEVQIEPKKNKLTVVGYVDPKKVVKRVRARTGKLAEPWPYVPYNLVYHPYAPGAYDKKAPPGYVRNVVVDPEKGTLARATSEEERVTSIFSDDNPNACIVM